MPAAVTMTDVEAREPERDERPHREHERRDDEELCRDEEDVPDARRVRHLVAAREIEGLPND